MRRIILAGVLVAPLIAVALWRWSPLAAIGVVFASHMFVLYPTLRPNVQWLGPVITHFKAEGNEVWLTIDDGPTSDTTAILEALDARGAKATFFVKGTLATADPATIREIVRRGHGIANHSWSHPSGTFWCLLPAQIDAEINRCNMAIASAAGEPSRLFRAPVGMKNPAVHPALSRRGMTLVGWTARAFDTQTDDVELVVRRILRDVSPGSIILMHQGRSTSVAMIAAVVDELQRSGYTFVIPSVGRLKTNR